MNKNKILSKLERETIATRRALVEKTRGRFFVVEFFKKDGSLRKMVCRAGVRRYISREGTVHHVNGTGQLFRPAKFGLMTVWDAQKKGYRNINLLAVQSLRCGNFRYKLNTREQGK